MSTDFPGQPRGRGDTITVARALPLDEPPKERHDLWQIVYAIQKDLSGASAKMMELRQMLSSIDLPESTLVKCPRCGLQRSGPRQLAEHMYVSHDGDMPSHWEGDA